MIRIDIATMILADPARRIRRRVRGRGTYISHRGSSRGMGSPRGTEWNSMERKITTRRINTSQRGKVGESARTTI